VTFFAGSLQSTVSETGAFTDGWDKAEWKYQRRLAKGDLHADQRSNHRSEPRQEQFLEQQKREPQLQKMQRDHLPFDKVDQKRLEKHQRIAHDIAASLLQQQLAQVTHYFIISSAIA
jgi:hypothetical protein